MDKSGVVGHQHAIEGSLSSGQWFLAAGQAGELVFDMQSFDADTARARKYLRLEGQTDAGKRQEVNENMRGERILDVQRYPEARPEHVTLKQTGATSKRDLPEYLMEGEFTLHGVTRPTRPNATRNWKMVGTICAACSASARQIMGFAHSVNCWAPWALRMNY